MSFPASVPALVAMLGGVPGAEPTGDPSALHVDDAPVLLWLDGAVRVRAGDPAPGSTAPTPQPPAASGTPTDRVRVGEALAHPFTQLDLGANGRVVLVADDTHLIFLAGPGTRTIRQSADGYALAGPFRLVRVPLSGDLPSSGISNTRPEVAPGALGATLELIAPDAPVARDLRPHIRWTWPYADAHFDLDVSRIDPASGTVLERVERWQNLQGSAHDLMGPLVFGATYRVDLALRSGSAASAVISDAREFRVLDRAELDQLGAALAELALVSVAETARDPLGDPYRPEFDILRARILERFGLAGEAQALWTGLSILHPERPELLAEALRLRALARTPADPVSPPPPRPE